MNNTLLLTLTLTCCLMIACTPKQKTAETEASDLAPQNSAKATLSNNQQPQADCRPEKSTRISMQHTHAVLLIDLTLVNIDAFIAQCDDLIEAIPTEYDVAEIKIERPIEFDKIVLTSRNTCQTNTYDAFTFNYISKDDDQGTQNTIIKSYADIMISSVEMPKHILVSPNLNIVDYELYLQNELVGIGQVNLNVSIDHEIQRKTNLEHCPVDKPKNQSETENEIDPTQI